MTRKISAVLLSALFVFSLLAVSALALDKQPDPKNRPVQYKHHAQQVFTEQELLQRERLVPDRSDYAEAIQAMPNYVPGSAAVQSAMGPSGLFKGVFAGNTTYDYQHNGGTQRQIEADRGTMTEGKRFVHVTWMCLTSFVISDNNRQINYNSWDPTIPGWTQSGDPSGGISLTAIGERGGYTHIDVNSLGNAVVMWHSAMTGGTNKAQITRFSFPNYPVFNTDDLTSLPAQANIWPNGEVGKSAVANGDIYHVVAQDSGPGPGDPASIAYWRYVYVATEYVWQGPRKMDSSITLSQHLYANGSRVVYVLAKSRDYPAGSQLDNDLAYYSCTDAGALWISTGPTAWASGGGFNCTDYVDTDPHRCYIDIGGGYDSEGRLHLIYNTQLYEKQPDNSYLASGGPSTLLHWDEGSPGSNQNAVQSGGTAGGFIGGTQSNFSTVARALWGWHGIGDGNDGSSGAWNRYICKMSLAFGSGTTNCGGPMNTDYLYATYTQFGSEDPVDKEDASDGGFQNGNIWLSISNDKGVSWAAGKCLTTVDSVGGTPSRSKDCDYTTGNPAQYCKSEHWSSSAHLVSDTLHVFYLGDLDAGGIAQGEGNWATNDVMYLRIYNGYGGGVGNPLCPLIAPVLGVTLSATPGCEYYVDKVKTVNNEVLSIDNFGNATLNYSGAIVYTAPASPPQLWMQFLGYGQTFPLNQIPLAGATKTYSVQMSKGSLPNGLYQAQIRVFNDDPMRDPYYDTPVSFFVADSFFCATKVLMTTPCVALEVSSVDSWAHESSKGGMKYYRETDEDSLYNPFFDGSLTIANKDVTGPEGEKMVYRDIFSNETPSNPGYRALEYPRISFNAADNDSVVAANECTVDSTIGVSVKYLFPQEGTLGDCEFVRKKIKVCARDDQTHHLIIGAAADIDAPGGDASGIGSENLGGYVEKYNLVFQHGTDTVREGANFWRYTNKYVAGMTAITCDPVKGMRIESNRDSVYPGSGFTDAYIYNQLNASGNSVWADSADDIHAILSIKEITLVPDVQQVFQFALLTSMAGQEDVREDLYDYPYDGYVADLKTTASKAWKKGFGWCGEFWMTSGSLETEPTSDIGWTATGTHEEGIGGTGACCGCDVSMTVDPPTGTITLVDNGCTGSVHFANTPEATYTITLTVSDLCGDQTDQVVFVVTVASSCFCGTKWGDTNNDGALNPGDVVVMVRYVYNQIDLRIFPPGWACPMDVGDWNCDGAKNPGDVVVYVRYVYNQIDLSCPNPCGP